ncbi:MAG: hypothetical protein ACOYL6_12230 [Bacteriovoracaceae bacterium]
MKKVLIALLFLMNALGAHAITAAQLKTKLLAMNNSQLHLEALKRTTYNGKSWSGVGACYISGAATCPSCACSGYAQINYSINGSNGLPASIPGSGCLAFKSTPMTPMCWTGWNAITPSICTSSMSTNAANQMRVALNAPGDICKLAEYAGYLTPTPTAGKRLSQMPVKFIVSSAPSSYKDPGFDPGSCAIEAKAAGNLDILLQLAPKKCKNLAYKLRAKSDNAVPPFILLAEAKRRMALGKIPTATISNIVSDLTFTLNAANQGIIDATYKALDDDAKLPSTNPKKLNPLDRNRLKDQIALANQKLVAGPTEAQIADAIQNEAGLAPAGYEAPAAVAAPTTVLQVSYPASATAPASLQTVQFTEAFPAAQVTDTVQHVQVQDALQAEQASETYQPTESHANPILPIAPVKTKAQQATQGTQGTATAM